ncbi:MAG: Stp1/IreP family PP2C-type Ser/Thr phosphatase [Deltaproteobacteria bacterium]|nr:Stp1/IreP family PP2C-type Ser/Thr phosphatase [Deltaproteobacteria bacterium]
MSIRHAGASDPGLVRKNNEDSFSADDGLGLYIVADGMGGHAGGEVASAAACEEIRGIISQNKDIIDEYRFQQSGVSGKEISSLLAHAVKHASARIKKMGEEKPELRGMGTTVEVALFIDDRAFFAHVGDSRIYLLRDGEVHQITKDHSLTNELLEMGHIQSADEVKARFRNAVTRALGFYDTVEVDLLDMDLFPKDRFLLCTDGLHTSFEGDALQRMGGKVDPETAVQNLIRHANSRGGRDNITALVVDVTDASKDRAGQVADRLDVLRGLALFRLLDYEELLRIHNLVYPKEFQSGERIFAEGDLGDSLYVVLRGKVEISKGSATVAHLGRGSHFGEMALVDRASRSADATALETTSCLLLYRDDFYGIIHNHARTAVKLLWSLARVLTVRLRTTTGELESLRQQYEQLNARTPVDPLGDTLIEF